MDPVTLQDKLLVLNHEQEASALRLFIRITQIERDVYVVRRFFVCHKAATNTNRFTELRSKLLGQKLAERPNKLFSMGASSESLDYLE